MNAGGGPEDAGGTHSSPAITATDEAAAVADGARAGTDGAATSKSASSSGGSGATPHTPHTSRASSSMGSEHKYPSSSREMRNMAEKMRRDKLNHYVNELAGIVPLGTGANKRIDKTSVLRLAANYIRMHKILKEDDGDSGRLPASLGANVTRSLAEAVGGFLLVVTSTGKVVYVTEAVDQFFGHSQVDLLGHSIYNVIHPDDHDIFQQQLTPKENNRRSFFCRMMEKALSRNDPGRYEIIHVVGQVRPLPQSATTTSLPCVLAPSPNGTNTSSDHEDDYESDVDGDSQSANVPTSRIGTHMLVSFVRVVKDRPITELSLVESTQDEYITRHGMDGKILYTDHRISFVTGLMPSEVMGTSAFNYMHPDDMVWSIVAQKLMFTSTQGQGIVSYRLKCRDGSHVTLRSRGYLEVNKQTGQVESFVCINTVLNIKEAANEIKNQRRKLLPIVTSQESDEHLSSISSSLPPELMMILKQMMNPETVQNMIKSVDSFGISLENEHSGNKRSTHSDTTGQQTRSHDLINQEDCNEANPFQSRPKRFCSFDAFSSSECIGKKSLALNETRVRDVDEVKWHSVPCKTSTVSTDSFSSFVTNKFSFDRETLLSCSDQAQENCSTGSSQSYPSTSALHKGNMNYFQTPDQQFGNNDLAYSEHSQQSDTGCVSTVVHYQKAGMYPESPQQSDTVHMPTVGSHPKSPQQHDTSCVSTVGHHQQAGTYPESTQQCDTSHVSTVGHLQQAGTYPESTQHCDTSRISTVDHLQQAGTYTESPQQHDTGHMHTVGRYEPAGTYSYQNTEDARSPGNCDQNINTNLPSVKTSTCNSRVDVLSPDTFGQNIRSSTSLSLPSNYEHSTSVGLSPRNQYVQDRSVAIFSSDSSQQTGSGSMLFTGTSLENRNVNSVSTSGNYPTTSDNLPSTGNYEQSRISVMTFSSSPRPSESNITNIPSGNHKYSCTIASPDCSYKPMDDGKITCSKDRSSGIFESQLSPQYFQTFKIQSSQQLLQQYHQRQPGAEHFQSTTSLIREPKYSTSPEFDIKMQRHQPPLLQKSHSPLVAQHDGEPEVGHIGFMTNSSQCLPYGSAVVSEGGKGVHQHCVTSASAESGIPVQCNTNFQLNVTHAASGMPTLPEVSTSHSQQIFESELNEHLGTRDVGEENISRRSTQVPHCQSFTHQGGGYMNRQLLTPVSRLRAFPSHGEPA
ncbi:uncharacterized protein [Procambarus clarkii]|uniref:uncharacterized protein isoform X1 n=1 Tax=Procambarus clarkii TaxID=6728 RepID=UPI001E675333|nr:single-minded homolog 1-like isoform X2 [Procambarus clarkii]